MNVQNKPQSKQQQKEPGGFPEESRMLLTIQIKG